MDEDTRLRDWISNTGSFVLGWALVVLGIPLMPLPGPGVIVLVAGVALLARHYVWAQKLLDPLRTRAISAAKIGVESRLRITMSALGGLWLFLFGIVWWISPTIPEFDFVGYGFGPKLPFAGWAVGFGLVVSALAGWSLLAYSAKRWR
ncbi:MAG: PGPGW domain-containing protein [Kineosporiaceae bacterium]|nr:PGPGW domain-containing protein [Aeromicrobium sp.]